MMMRTFLLRYTVNEMASLLDGFADAMAESGFKTFRCQTQGCRAVLWLESDDTLEDIVRGSGGVTLMRYAQIPEDECAFCAAKQKVARRMVG